jgi:acetolactate synthase I/II/III large subunit
MAASVGTAIATPNRPILTLESDGSGMYMPQALWTQARERLNITTLIFANKRYEILRQEMGNVGVPKFGTTAEGLLTLDDPIIEATWVFEGSGVASTTGAKNKPVSITYRPVHR